MQFKYVAKTNNRTAKMLLYDQIGGEGINGNLFAYEMNWIGESGQYDQINLHINCIGGNIVQGFSIFAAMTNSPIPVYVYIDFMAASMGGIIAMGGKKIYMAENGLLMVHAPSNPDNPNEESEILNKMMDALVNVFEQRTGSNMRAALEKETWFNASEAKQAGLVDEVFRPIIQKKAAAKLELSYVNKISHQLINAMEPLEKEILQGELDKAKKALADKEQELLGLKNENEELTKKLSDSEKAIQTQKDKEAVEYVENLVKVGKLKNESKEAVIESAKKDLSLVKNVYDSIPAPTVQRLSNVAASGKVETAVNEGWTIRDYEKKDPKALLKIKNEQPEVYQAMFDAEYKK